MEIQLWRELLEPYQLAIDELLVKFQFLIREHRGHGMYSPIETVDGRVKKISSILEKMQKKNISFDEIEEKIDDLAGIRIICQFTEDIDAVVDMIKQRSDMVIKEEKDYIRNPKKSGYRSYHLIVYYDVFTMKGTRKIKVEIQIRTLAMNFWATVEHSLQYKYRGHLPERIWERMSGASKAVQELDSEMSKIRSEIMDSQNEFQLKAQAVAEILNSINNLYKVLNRREIAKLQDEFYQLYKLDDLEVLREFGKELDVSAENNRVQELVKYESVNQNR